jgi:hypothetical protein
MDLVKRKTAALSYPKAVADAIAEVQAQGFICSEPALKTCEKRNHKPDAYGKSGWTFRAIDPKERRFPWDVWVFPDGTFDDEAQAVEAEILGPIPSPDAPKTKIEISSMKVKVPEAIDVEVHTEPLALPESTEPCL